MQKILENQYIQVFYTIYRFELSNLLNNRSKFRATYHVNTQLKKEFEGYYKYLKDKYKEKFTRDTYLFASQKMNKRYNPRSVYRIFSDIYKKFYIHGGTHMGRHIYITKLIDNGINPFIVQKLANHKK